MDSILVALYFSALNNYKEMTGAKRNMGAWCRVTLRSRSGLTSLTQRIAVTGESFPCLQNIWGAWSLVKWQKNRLTEARSLEGLVLSMHMFPTCMSFILLGSVSSFAKLKVWTGLGYCKYTTHVSALALSMAHTASELLSFLPWNPSLHSAIDLSFFYLKPVCLCASSSSDLLIPF